MFEVTPLTIVACCLVMFSIVQCAYLPANIPSDIQLPQQLHYYNHPIVYQLSSYIYKLDQMEPHSTKTMIEVDVPANDSEPESVNEAVEPEDDAQQFVLIDAPAACRPGEAIDNRGKCKKIVDLF